MEKLEKVTTWLEHHDNTVELLDAVLDANLQHELNDVLEKMLFDADVKAFCKMPIFRKVITTMQYFDKDEVYKIFIHWVELVTADTE